MRDRFIRNSSSITIGPTLNTFGMHYERGNNTIIMQLSRYEVIVPAECQQRNPNATLSCLTILLNG